jgi:hypothetical protein
MWPHVLPLLARTEHAETVATCRELVEQEPVAARAWLAAAAAVRGDATALEVLRAELREDDVARRTTAVKALLAVELPRELAPVLLDDPDPSLRALAAAGIASLAPDEETHEWLSRGLDDPSDPVRVACIGALLDRGDAAATDRVLFLLDAQQPLFQLAFDLLRRTPENPLPADLARRAFERLVARDAAESHLPVASRQPLYQAIGVLPLADAARWLRERGLALDEPLGGLRAHRWMTMQASNGGPAGRAWLAAELAGERDPLRRIDLLWAVSTHSDDLARETLLARVEDPDVDPYELLFVADRLANVGPPSLVAPLLKRVTLRVQQDDVRAALQCLLWRWY